MSGELFLLKSMPVNSFLSLRFDLFNIILSLCTSFLPTEETVKANHTDLQPARPPLPAELHGWVSAPAAAALLPWAHTRRWGKGNATIIKTLALVRP